MIAPPQVSLRRLLAAQISAVLFAMMFTIWTGGTLVLIAAIPNANARPERIGYALATGAAALCFWVMVYLIRKITKPRLN